MSASQIHTLTVSNIEIRGKKDSLFSKGHDMHENKTNVYCPSN